MAVARLICVTAQCPIVTLPPVNPRWKRKARCPCGLWSLTSVRSAGLGIRVEAPLCPSVHPSIHPIRIGGWCLRVVLTWRGWMEVPPPFNKISLARPAPPHFQPRSHAHHGRLLNIEPPSFGFFFGSLNYFGHTFALSSHTLELTALPRLASPLCFQFSTFEGLIWLPLPRHCPPTAARPPPSLELPLRFTVLFSS